MPHHRRLQRVRLGQARLHVQKVAETPGIPEQDDVSHEALKFPVCTFDDDDDAIHFWRRRHFLR